MTLLEVEGLSVRFASPRGDVRAVTDVSLRLAPGESLALVGESGSGKSTVLLALMGLLPRATARVEARALRLGGRDLLATSERELARVRGREIALVFQDPTSALHPLLTIGTQLAEVLARHTSTTRRERRAACAQALADVGIADPERRLAEHPHQLSGGMRQRVAIAMALLARPALLLADEPTTALDPTLQAQVLELVARARERRGTALLLVTHDLGVVAAYAQRVHVLYAGRTVEEAGSEALFDAPRHPYTRALLASVPRLDGPLTPRAYLPGTPPDPARLSEGCAFAPRCALAHERCARETPPLEALAPERRAACFALELAPRPARAGGAAR